MDLMERISDAFSGEETGETTQYECSRCGARYDRLRTPCEECGSDVMVPLE